MTNLNVLSEKEILHFIKERLKVSKNEQESILSNFEGFGIYNDVLRFEMSGYEKNKGDCTLWNLNVLNRFADLGIYDYTEFLVLDFYKGCGTLYYKYFQEPEFYELDVCGEGTKSIILKIFNLTILSGRTTRRRD